jgi:hypothetical protein
MRTCVEQVGGVTMKQLVLGSLLAAVVLFFWGFVFWGLLPNPGFQEPANEEAVWQSLDENLPETGAYYIPDPEGDSESVARHESGPTAFLFVRNQGSPVMSVSMMAFGFVHMFITALLIGLLLRQASPRLPTYGKRVLFVVLVGAVATFWFDIAWPVWWGTPWTFFLWMAVYDVVAWTLAGVVLARFVQPMRGTQPLGVESMRTSEAPG